MTYRGSKYVAHVFGVVTEIIKVCYLDGLFFLLKSVVAGLKLITVWPFDYICPLVGETNYHTHVTKVA
jgi:hypothetical protein